MIKLTQTELNNLQQLLTTYPDAQPALAILESNNGQLETSFDTLWTAKNSTPEMYSPDQSLWQVTLKVIRQEICGDEGFRSKILDYNKNPGSASLLTGSIVYLVHKTQLPIDPAIATIIILYITKVGLNIFCEYTDGRMQN